MATSYYFLISHEQIKLLVQLNQMKFESDRFHKLQ